MSDTQDVGEYNIARDKTFEQLVERVNALMKHGWMPLGASYYVEGSIEKDYFTTKSQYVGLNVSNRKASGFWMQTMVKLNKD